ncbi:hypothetical protein, partial [Candidatus Binatus sp.]|uniref:hypothetical protein n=1 Tax=Candidatus Binatus sp. TaxID=2811406 RepID=UPI003BAF9442
TTAAITSSGFVNIDDEIPRRNPAGYMLAAQAVRRRFHPDTPFRSRKRPKSTPARPLLGRAGIFPSL